MDKEQKIIIMTRLALYEKRYGAADKHAGSFFRHDYVYWKNFWNRVYALLGALLIAGLYIFYQVMINGVDVFEIDYRAEGIRLLIFIAAVMFISSAISSYKSTREYSAIQKRLAEQIVLCEKLEGKGDLTESYGANINRKKRRG